MRRLAFCESGKQVIQEFDETFINRGSFSWSQSLETTYSKEHNERHMFFKTRKKNRVQYCELLDTLRRDGSKFEAPGIEFGFSAKTEIDIHGPRVSFRSGIRLEAGPWGDDWWFYPLFERRRGNVWVRVASNENVRTEVLSVIEHYGRGEQPPF